MDVMTTFVDARWDMTTLFLRTSNGHDTEKPYANNDREKLPRRFGQGEECVSSFLTLFIGYRDERTPGMKRCDIPFRQSYARDDPNDMCTCGYSVNFFECK
uniref:Uncharacterized protein n=1 Tax=Pristionchus pacificus TaxID=54126 RepID=A0A2A6BTJ2_PRIPA|eukprot:PDM69214.1 hypothetical protein PRIPAC_47516 [Pristionchus pacificus]